MKKKFYLTAFLVLYNIATYAQGNIPSENEVTTNIKNLIIYGISTIALVVGIAMAGWAGISYMFIPEEQRSAEQTKKLVSTLTRIGIGTVISAGAPIIIDLIYSYI